MSEVRVAPMRRRDLRSVIRIDAQQPEHSWSVGLYLAELRRSRPGAVEGAGYDRRYVVARADGRVVGFAGALFQPPDAHVTVLAVDAAVRRCRIGTRLMVVVARLAITAGCNNLTLEVRARNTAAIALYRRLGLAPVGIRAGYYADSGEDALIMWATDLGTAAYAERLARIESRLGEPTVVEGLET